jgi:hypothetical protein
MEVEEGGEERMGDGGCLCVLGGWREGIWEFGNRFFVIFLFLFK